MDQQGPLAAMQRDGTKVRGKVTVAGAWYDLDCVVEGTAVTGKCSKAGGGTAISGAVTGVRER